VGNLEGGYGTWIIFSTEADLWEAYNWNTQHATSHQVECVASRMKVANGGVSHPWKVIITGVVGPTFGLARTALQQKLGQIHLKDHLQYSSEEYFEKWIDLEAKSKLENGLINYNAYVYHKTKEAALATITALRGQKFNPQASCIMKAYGAVMPVCNLCNKDGHKIEQCSLPGLRIELSQPCNVTLRNHLQRNLDAFKVTSGKDNGRECNWAYVFWNEVEKREEALAEILKLVGERTIIEVPRYVSNYLEECWRCGAIHEDEIRNSRQPHNGGDKACPAYPRRPNPARAKGPGGQFRPQVDEKSRDSKQERDGKQHRPQNLSSLTGGTMRREDCPTYERISEYAR
jgi:hypothetical protein